MIRSKAALADGIGIDICSNETIRDGYCYGLAICGYCYNTNEDVVIKISDNYEIFNMVVISIILPIICIVGLAGNTVSAFIYSRKVMLSSMNVYLCALAISDMTVVLTAFFLFYLENVRRRSLFISKYYAIMTPVLFPLGLTAQTFSVFLTLIAAIDCFVLVAAPQSFKKHFCAIPRSVQILFVILFIAIIYNSPHIFEIYVIDCWSRRYAQKTVDVCPTDLRLNENYVKIYYAWMYTIIMAVGPMLSLILLNSAIVFFIKRNSSKESRNDSDIITLVLVVCLFIFCNILPVTVNFLELIFGVTNPYLLDMSNLIVVLNSSCNFMIYYMFGSRFRRTLQQYIKYMFSCSTTESNELVIGHRSEQINSLIPSIELLI